MAPLRTAGIVHGTISDFDVRGRLSAERIIARGSGLNRARVEYAVSHGGTPRMKYVVGGSFDSLSASGFALDSATLLATYLEALGHRGARGVSGFGLRVSRRRGVPAQPRQQSRCGGARCRCSWTPRCWVSAVPGYVQWGKQGMLVHDLDLRNRSGGRIYANGELPVNGPMSFDLDVHGLEIANLVGLAESDLAATGTRRLAGDGSAERSARRSFAGRSA